MGPRIAAARFKSRLDKPPARIDVTLYGSLAATGKGHMTDRAIRDEFAPAVVSFEWRSDDSLPEHPNGMCFRAMDANGTVLSEKQYLSIGGGAIREVGVAETEGVQIYPNLTLAEILSACESEHVPFWRYVENMEGVQIWNHLSMVWDTMRSSICRGLEAEGVLPGGLGVRRKSRSFHRKAQRNQAVFQRTGLIAGYALAVAEENAAGGRVVTAPTCGSCGVLPSVLLYLQNLLKLDDQDVLHALAVGGLFGNIVKHRASISGAEAGCQAEIGTACSMAAAAAAELMGGSLQQIEYAAEMGLEHHLGLTCDPIGGLVQIPCIERNAMAATRALDCADYALLSDGRHHVSFDEVVETMKQTGNDLPSLYRETSCGGLARIKRYTN
jgi:L-serine dehydratase